MNMIADRVMYLTDNNHKLTCFVIMTVRTYFNFQADLVFYKNGALLAKL